MMPSLFLAHGAPSIVLEEHGYTDFLKRAAQAMPTPKAIVVFTAHWEDRIQQISSVSQYETIHDFYGFNPKLYEQTYPANGSSELANDIAVLFGDQHIDCELDTKRGLDHGSWSVLKLLYPNADIPVVQLSVNPALGSAQQYAIGKALAPLKEQGVLIIGSGGTVHNLREVNFHANETEAWANQFEEWLGEVLTNWSLDDLFTYESKAPYAAAAVPRAEHFIPLLLAMGAGDQDKQAALLHKSFQYGTLSLTAWQFS